MVRSAELLLHERMPRRLVLQEPQTARADEALPDPELDRPVGAGARHARYAAAARRPAGPPALHGHGDATPVAATAATRSWRSPAGGPTGPATTPGSSATSRTSTRGGRGRPRTSPSALRPTGTARCSRPIASRSSAPTATSRPEPRSPWFRPTPPRCGGSPSPTTADETREIELTSYGEIVLAPPDADRAHPAFSNLFVETEWHEWCTAITATRRPRSATERPLWCVHVVATGKERVAR